MQAIDRLWVRRISQLGLFQCPLQAPFRIGMVALKQFLLIDELCILVVDIIILRLCHLHRLLHVFVRLGKLIGSHLQTCAVDIAVCSVGIVCNEAVDIVCILLSIHTRSTHEERQQGIIVFVGDGKWYVDGLESSIAHAESVGMQADGKRSTDGITGGTVLVCSSLSQSYNLPLLVEDGTTLLLFLSLQG